MGFWKTMDFILFCWYFSSCMQRRTLSSSPCCSSFWKKCCIASLCAAEAPRWDLKFMLRILPHVLIALWLCSAESSPWATEIGNPKKAVRWWFLVFESGTSTCFTPALGVSKRHIRHQFILALHLSQLSVQDCWTLNPWSNAHQWLAAHAQCPAPSKVPQPNKAFRSLQKCSCNLHISKTVLQKILHFIS